jgi:hypothetical protein
MIRFEVVISTRWASFLWILVANVVSLLTVRTYSKKIILADSVSMLNWIVYLRLLRWLKESYDISRPWGHNTNVPSTYRSHSDDLHSSKFSECSMNVMCMTWLQFPRVTPSFYWKKLSSIWKVMVRRQSSGSSTMASTVPSASDGCGFYLWGLVLLRRLAH